MGLPAGLKNLRRRSVKSAPSTADDESIFSQPPSHWYKLDLRRNTRARRIFALTAAGAYLLSWIFLVLIEIGNTNGTKVLGDIYFFRLSLANIIPESIENAELINSIARGLGLHDFYQPGLWNYCEGYQDEGITHCSTPESYYWFNIVQVILDELLSGATIALPSELTQILNILKLCSHLMFAFFLTGTVLAFVLVFLSPVAIFSRWWSLPMAFLSAVTFVLILAASTIASVISFVFKYAATAQSSLNIEASVGMKMFIFMWIATGCALVGFILHAGMGCCCTSRRDLKRGTKPMRHSSLHRAMSQRSQRSQRSQGSQMSHARNVSMVAGGQGRSRSNTAFSFEQPTGNRSRSGTLLSMSEVPAARPEAAVTRSGSQHGSSGSVSRSGTLRDNSESVSRSGTIKSEINRSNTVKSNLAQTGRSRSGTMRSIRFDDERPPSYESDVTAVNGTDGAKEGVPAARQRHSTLPEEE